MSGTSSPPAAVYKPGRAVRAGKADGGDPGPRAAGGRRCSGRSGMPEDRVTSPPAARPERSRVGGGGWGREECVYQADGDRGSAVEPELWSTTGPVSASSVTC